MARCADKSSVTACLVAPSGSAGQITTCPRRSHKEKAPDHPVEASMPTDSSIAV
jgi:hypothetical protein